MKLINLNFEGESPEKVEDVKKRITVYSDLHHYYKKKFDLHELVLKPKLDLFEGCKVAEIGVGEGSHLASYSGLDYMGFDIFDSCVGYARNKAAKYGIDPTRIMKMEEEEIPLEDQSIDRLFSVCTLHEFNELDKTILEMQRILKPDGKLAIIERMCAIDESPEAIAQLKKEPLIFPVRFPKKRYQTKNKKFKATYYGESTSNGFMFNFYMFSARGR